MIRTLIWDTLLAMLLAVVAIVMLVLPSVAPATKEAPLSPPGNLVATINWPAGSIDVDLRVGAPNDGPVDYSRKSGRTWSLLRDDLGTANDDTPLNYESAFTRGLPDGEYAVNVRCFGCAGKVPVVVGVEVRLAEGGLVWSGPVQLDLDKQEKTAIRFRIAGGKVVAGSANHVFKMMK
jgi:hypothetical protein